MGLDLPNDLVEKLPVDHSALLFDVLLVKLDGPVADSCTAIRELTGPLLARVRG
jgi:hypothetical protein